MTGKYLGNSCSGCHPVSLLRSFGGACTCQPRSSGVCVYILADLAFHSQFFAFSARPLKLTWLHHPPSPLAGGLPPPAHQLLLRPSRIDARNLFGGDVGPVDAPPLLRSLCRHCCVPSLALRAMHARIHLAGFEGFRIEEAATDVVQLIATSGAAELFSQEQLQVSYGNSVHAMGGV